MEQANLAGLNFCDLAKYYVKNCLKHVENVKYIFAALYLHLFIHSTSF